MADLRKCIGSKRYGIEAHEAPVGDFPSQPSQKDGLGRMCKPHWNQYTTALRKVRLARKADGGAATAPIEHTSNQQRRAAAQAAGKVPAADGTVPAPKAKAPRSRKGGPIGYIGSEPGGPAEILPGGKKRRIASTPKGNRHATKREAEHLPSANSQSDAG
jgi:hypothetical protein